MKNLLLTISSLLILLGCDNNIEPKSKNTKKENTTENFDWLIGKWKRTNDKEGNETFEIWHKINREKYKGWGYTMKNNDTISFENISLIKTNSSWKLIVKTEEDKKATYFDITEFSKNSFTCENKKNEFPNKIHYWKDGRILKATVSNSKLQIDFLFDRVKGKVTSISSLPKKD